MAKSNAGRIFHQMQVNSDRHAAEMDQGNRKVPRTPFYEEDPNPVCKDGVWIGPRNQLPEGVSYLSL
tara:strand:+ start:207 stop:407 length:201 start_codon:yes stop_codon:yes gene_type:complete